VDWNNDGLEDFILGDMDGYVNFFQRYDDGIYDLQAPVHIQAMGEDIDVESMAGPACVLTAFDGTRTRLDWNEDGLWDLAVGAESLTGTPTLRVYLNTGTNENPEFESYSFIKAAGEDIHVSRLNPHIVDLDGDGKKDIIAGNHYGDILFFRNIGLNSNPVFAEQVPLYSNGQPIDINTGSKIWPEDMNGDGTLDILASDYDGLIYVFPGLPQTLIEDNETEGNQPSLIRMLSSPVSGGNIEVSLSIPSRQNIILRMFDSSGRVIYSSDLGLLEPGVQSQVINISEIAPGVYFVSVQGELASCSRKVTVLR